jgi:Rad3-related DNA helicase
MNTGKMSYTYLNSTLPKIVKSVDNLLDEFPDQKGIIHATSYKIARYVADHSRHWERIISHNSVDRMEKLEEHLTSPEPTVLLSPSMTEGVDLKGDLSKFQIIVKLPYASLGDKQIKARMEDDKIWYASLVATQLMQAYGRSIRSKNDVAMTFVLDSGFKWFLKSNEGLFCNWFKEAVK